MDLLLKLIKQTLLKRYRFVTTYESQRQFAGQLDVSPGVGMLMI